MKKIKKLIYLLFLVWANVVYGQSEQVRPTVLLLGTVHSFEDSIDVFEDIRKRLVDFEPDIICIENIPPWDTLSLANVRASSLEQARQLRQEKEWSGMDLENLKDSLMAVLEDRPEDLLARSSLANVQYARHNFYNAYYHWYILNEMLSTRAPTEDLLLSFALDSIHQRVGKNHYNTEFGRIVFPVAASLGIHQLESIDDRSDDPAFARHGKKLLWRLIFNFKVFKALKIYKKEKQKLAGAPGNEVMAYINSVEFRTRLNQLTEELPTRWSRSSKTSEMVKLWMTRNQRMSERIIETVQRNQAKKVLVVFGAAHVGPVQQILEETTELNVITFDRMK